MRVEKILFISFLLYLHRVSSRCIITSNS